MRYEKGLFWTCVSIELDEQITNQAEKQTADKAGGQTAPYEKPLEIHKEYTESKRRTAESSEFELLHGVLPKVGKTQRQLRDEKNNEPITLPENICLMV